MSVALAVHSEQGAEVSITLPWFIDQCVNDDTPDRKFFITKGLGSGGTYGAAIWHIHMCLINWLSPRSWAIAPTFQQVQDTLIPTFIEVLTEQFHYQEGVDFEVVRSAFPKIRLVRHNQEIWFKSASRPERFVGPSISHFTMTEPGLCKPEAFEKAEARRRCPRAVLSQSMFEGTPEGMGNRWEQIANIDEGVHVAKNARRLTVWTTDNKYLKPGYGKQLEDTYSYDKAKLESYLYGRFVPFTKGTAYWEFVHSRNVKLNLIASQFSPIIFAFDLGVAPLAWVANQVQSYERKSGRYNRIVTVAEGDGKARGILDMCAQFIHQFDPAIYRDTPIEIDGGADGYSGSALSPSCAFDQVLKHLKRYYTNVRVVALKAAPPIEARLNKVAELMAREQYVCAAWCRNLIYSLTNSSLKEGTWELVKKQGRDSSGESKDPTHFADALCATLWRLTKDLDLSDPNYRPEVGVNIQL